jgi:excisionase family DNA binding protein
MDARTSMSAEILTVREVADYLKVTERTVYRLLSEKQIPAFKVGGAWRFRRAQLNEWIEQRTVVEEEHELQARTTAQRTRSTKGRR